MTTLKRNWRESYYSRLIYILLPMMVIVAMIAAIVLVGIKKILGKKEDDPAQIVGKVPSLSYAQKQRLFDVTAQDENGDNNMTNPSPILSDSRALVARACDYQPVLCLADSQCALLCQNAAIKNYHCDQQQHICIDHALPISRNQRDQISDHHCNTRLGEYALLQGYNELGIAQWHCIRLYPSWNDFSRYCEGGHVELDVRHQPPSYRNCTCPEGTTRMVYRQSILGQESNGLPHCVTHPQLYSLDYVAV